jgi:hypothetical protein
MSFNLNYDDMFILDAEELAEGSIGQTYESLLPKLRKYVKNPAQIEEVLDNDTPRYSIRCRGKEFKIFAPELDEVSGNSWGRATVAFFTIVNGQLEESDCRFYAINDGNDLGGIFLTPAQAKAAQKGLPNKRDWPYLPKDEHPWYGRYH